MFKNPTVKRNAFRTSCANVACFSSRLIFTYFYAGNSIIHESEKFVSCMHLSFVNLALHPTPQTKIYRVKPEDSRSSILVTIHNYTHVHSNLFLYLFTYSTEQSPSWEA
jgi:hypothetical protein